MFIIVCELVYQFIIVHQFNYHVFSYFIVSECILGYIWIYIFFCMWLRTCGPLFLHDCLLACVCVFHVSAHSHPFKSLEVSVSVCLSVVSVSVSVSLFLSLSLSLCADIASCLHAVLLDRRETECLNLWSWWIRVSESELLNRVEFCNRNSFYVCPLEFACLYLCLWACLTACLKLFW